MGRATITKQKEQISRVKLGNGRQIVIPSQTIKRLDLAPGREFELKESRDGIMLTPLKKKIPKDQEWYHTPRWQKMMQEAFDAYDNGRTLGPFDSMEEFKEAIKIRNIHR